MRRIVFLLLLGGGFAPAGDSDRTITNEEFNFSVARPDSLDWETMPLNTEANPHAKAHFRTFIADSEPPADADVQLLVKPLAVGQDKVTLKKIADNWRNAFEGHLTNLHDRTEQLGKFGGAECYETDLKGVGGEGVHHRSWLLARMGKYLYVYVVDRRHAAVGDESIESEIKTIRQSFRFLREEKPTGEGGDGDAPVPGAGPKKPAGDVIDPALLKQEKLNEDFWRFECIKPAGFVRDVLRDEDKSAHVKFRFTAKNPEGALCIIYLYIDTTASAKYTLEQLKASAIKYFTANSETAKIKTEEDNYKGVPMSKKALMWEAVKVGSAVIKEKWILADCKNDRQYQIRIYTISNGDQIFKDQIEAFLKSFKPRDR